MHTTAHNFAYKYIIIFTSKCAHYNNKVCCGFFENKSVCPGIIKTPIHCRLQKSKRKRSIYMHFHRGKCTAIILIHVQDYQFLPNLFSVEKLQYHIQIPSNIFKSLPTLIFHLTFNVVVFKVNSYLVYILAALLSYHTVK